MKLKGIAPAEFQLADIYKAKNLTADTSGIETLFESMEPQEYTFKQAKEFLDDDMMFRTLNFGQKLNCVRAYAAELCKDLKIRIPEVYFAKYKPIKGVGTPVGSIWRKAELLTINYTSGASEIKLGLPHELKHYQQLLITDKGYMPPASLTTPSKETIDEWNNSAKYPYWVQPIEVDAEQYASDVCDKKFSYFRAHTLQKRELADRIAEKESITKKIKEMTK